MSMSMQLSWQEYKVVCRSCRMFFSLLSLIYSLGASWWSPLQVSTRFDPAYFLPRSDRCYHQVWVLICILHIAHLKHFINNYHNKYQRRVLQFGSQEMGLNNSAQSMGWPAPPSLPPQQIDFIRLLQGTDIISLFFQEVALLKEKR